MKTATHTALCDRRLQASRDAHFSRLAALFAGKAPERVVTISGSNTDGTALAYTDPETWTEQALDQLASRAEALADPLVFRPLIVSVNAVGPYGVHFIDRMFGADVFELDGERENWQAHVLPQPVGRLQAPDLARDPTWALARRLARAFLDADVALPLFAMPCIASVLNVAMNLYGQELLVAMMTDRAAAYRDLRIIHELQCTLHRWYRQHIPIGQLQATVACNRTQPPNHGQLCGCSTQLLSPDLYRDFIAPLDEELLAIHPAGGMIHLCGTHTQHIPVWRKMKSLRAIQINDRAAEDIVAYSRGLREDQVIYVGPCAGMPVERIMEITGGRRIVLQADIKDPPATRQPA